MKLAALLDGIEIIETNADMSAEIADVCCDSRRAAGGCLFVAVEGYETDGHKYIPSALDKGAAAVLCRVKPAWDCTYILCADTRRALAVVSANFFDRPTE
ncbi:MAG: Mur ligase domain-containing protein, partial [Clostridiales bacterium]|nr:Mur ligase domain-containing protein [Clostridiales bacterium]